MTMKREPQLEDYPTYEGWRQDWDRWVLHNRSIPDALRRDSRLTPQEDEARRAALMVVRAQDARRQGDAVTLDGVREPPPNRAR